MPNDITQRLGFDAGNAIAQVNALSGALDRLRVSMLGVGTASRNFQGNTAAFEQSLGTMNASLKTTSQQFNNMGTASQAAALGTKGLVDAQGNVLTSSKGVASAVETTSTSLGKAGTAGKKAGSDIAVSWQTIARVIQVQVVVRALNAIIGAFHDAGSAAIDFQLAIAEIETIAGGSLGTFEDIGKRVREMSRELGVPAEIVAEGVYQTLSNQVVDAGQAFEFTAEAQKLAIATHSETADAVNALSSVLNSYRDENIDAAHAADVLFKTVELGRLRLADVADILGRVLPITSQMGVQFEEAAAAVAAMTQSGVRADTAITQLRAIMLKIIKPTEAMTEVFAKWGVRDGKDAIEAFGGLRGVLTKLGEEVGGNNAEMAKFFNRVRAITGQMALTTEQGDRFNNVFNEMEASVRASGDAFDVIEKTDARDVIKSMNNLQNSLEEMGDTVIAVGKHFLSFSEIFINSGDEMLALITALSVGILVKAVPAIFTMTGATLSWAGAAATVSAAFATILPVLVLIAAVMAGMRLVNLIREWNDETGQFIEQTRAGTELMRKAHEQMQKRISTNLAEEIRARTDITFKYFSSLSVMYNDAIEDASISTKVITQSWESAAEQVVSAWDKALKRIDEIQQGVDSGTKKSQSEFQKLQRELGDDLFKSQTRQLKGSNLYYAQQKRGVETAAKAARLFAEAGSNEELQKSARAVRDIADAQLESALRTAEGVKDQKLIQLAERNIRNLKEQSATSEIKFQAEIRKLADESHRQQLKNLKEAQTEVKILAKEWAKLSDPVGKGAEQLKNDAKEAAEIATRIKELLTSEEYKNAADAFDLKNFDKLSANFIKALETAKVDWTELSSDLTSTLQTEYREVGVNLVIENQAEFRQQLSGLGLDLPALDPQQDIGSQLKDRQRALESYKSNYLSSTAEMAAAENEATNALDISNEALQDRSKFFTFWQRLADQARKTSPYQSPTPHTVGLIEQFRNKILAVNEAIKDRPAEAQTTYQELADWFNANKADLSASTEQEKLLTEAFNNTRTAIENKITASKKAAELDKQALNPETYKAIVTALESLTTSTQTAIEQQKQSAEVIATTAESAKTSAQGINENIGNATTSMGGLQTQTVSANTAMTTLEASANRTAAALAVVISRQQVIAASGVATQNAGGRMGFFAAGGRGTDTIPAMLSPNEFVMNARSARQFFPQLNAMNAGQTPTFREQGGNVTTVGDISVTVESSGDSTLDGQQIARVLRRDLRRKTIKLN